MAKERGILKEQGFANAALSLATAVRSVPQRTVPLSLKECPAEDRPAFAQ